jgi:hypothetical protein
VLPVALSSKRTPLVLLKVDASTPLSQFCVVFTFHKLFVLPGPFQLDVGSKTKQLHLANLHAIGR